MDSFFAFSNKDTLDAQLRQQRKVWYHRGARANLEGSDEARADQWIKANYQLRALDAETASGLEITAYEILTKPVADTSTQ